MKEGEESYTANLCQKCYNETLKAKGEKPLTKWQWHEFVKKNAHRGRLWKMMGKEQHVREMWEYFLPRKSKSKKVSRGDRRRKACRYAGSVATGIASPKVLGTS